MNNYFIMIATIISVIAAIGAIIWGFIERQARNLLNESFEALETDNNALQTKLNKTEDLLEEEKSLLIQQRKKMLDLEKELAAKREAEVAAKSAIVENEFDIAGLVDVSDPFKINGDERVVFFEFYKDRGESKEIRWRLKAKNNKVLADSGEGYGTKQNLKKALGVMLNAIKNGEIKSKWRS